MSDWKHLCDYRPMAGSIIEVIGKLVHEYYELDLYFTNKLKQKTVGIGREVRMYYSEFDFTILEKSNSMFKMRSPMQYREMIYPIDDIQCKNVVPKFDWSYC